jgi:uracil-DNA glycosylase
MSSANLPFVDYQYPAEENPNGLIVLVGEAPGAEEVKQGKPFVGRSGQLLDKNLKAAGLERNKVLVANVFRVRPPDNKVAHFFISKRKAEEEGEGIVAALGKFGGKFARAVFAPEVEHLEKTLKKLKPKVIVTLGSTPLWALTGKEGILSLRGQKQECRFLPDVPVIPTYHPSYILRGNWVQEPLFKNDLETAKQLAEKS